MTLPPNAFAAQPCGVENVDMTTESQAKDAYEIWIQVVEDNPKPWAALQPQQRAVWIKSIQEMEAWPPSENNL